MELRFSATASVAENINISVRRLDLLGGLFLRHQREAALAEEFIRRLRIKTPNRQQEIRLLSGGNQQKVILARWLAEPGLNVLILDEPTRGIDVGAKNDIYRIIHEVAERGCCVIVISSELPEVLGISDRVIVMREGEICGELARADASETEVLRLALPDTAAATAAAATAATAATAAANPAAINTPGDTTESPDLSTRSIA